MPFTLNVYLRGALVFDLRAWDQSNGTKPVSVLFVDGQTPGLAINKAPLLPHFAQLIVHPRDLEDPKPTDFEVHDKAWCLSRLSKHPLPSAEAIDLEQPSNLAELSGRWFLKDPKVSFMLPREEEITILGSGLGTKLAVVGRTPNEVPSQPTNSEPSGSFKFVPSISLLHPRSTVPDLKPDVSSHKPSAKLGVCNRLDLAHGELRSARVTSDPVEFLEESGSSKPVLSQRLSGLMCWSLAGFEDRATVAIGGKTIKLKAKPSTTSIDILLVNDPVDATVNDDTHKGEDFELNYLPFLPGQYKKRAVKNYKHPGPTVATAFPNICPPTTKP